MVHSIRKINLFYLCFLGAWIFVEIEKDNETERRSLKEDYGKQVDESTFYFSNIFYWYIHDADEYNYTETQ